MELLLNLVWALTTGILFVWWSLSGRGTTRTWRFMAGTLTVVGVALQLFPVISMTDDLNPSMYYAEDVSAVKRLARSTAAAQQHVTPHALPAIPSAAVRLASPPLLGALVVECTLVSYTSPRPSLVTGRSPPPHLA